MLINASVNDTDKSMEMSYEKFSGKRSRIIELKKNAKISIEITSITGKTALNITDKNGDRVFKSNSLLAGLISVVVGEDSEYTIKLTAKSHKGSYKISWE